MCACVYVWETKHPCIFEFINIYSKDVRLNRQFSIYMQSILSFQVNIDFLLLLLLISTWLMAVCKEWKSLSGCESAVDVMTFWAWNGSWFFKDLSFLRKKQNCSWNLTNHKEWLMAQLFISKSFFWSLQKLFLPKNDQKLPTWERSFSSQRCPSEKTEGRKVFNYSSEISLL